MSWENILKEKFQGPQKEHAGVSMINEWGNSNSTIDHFLKAIEEEVEKHSDFKPLIKGYLLAIRKAVDKADDALIELAKYGGQNIEPHQDRVDEKYIGPHSGKYDSNR